MDHSAQGDKFQILITDISSFLGSKIAQSFLEIGHTVYGAGQGHPEELVLTNPKFTLLDIDLAQPFPGQLPNFDTIIHFVSEDLERDQAKLSASSKNISSFAKVGKSKVIFATKVTTNPEIFNNDLEDSDLFKLFLVGDIYGPGMKLHNKYHTKVKASYFESNELINLISQAVETDRIILENEGNSTIYPTYINDATEAFLKFSLDNSPNNIRFIVSSNPQTALQTAYEIQNSTRITAQKDLNLFFAGEESFIKPKPEPVVRIHDLSLPTKNQLKDGLQKTLEFFKKEDKIKLKAIPQQEPDAEKLKDEVKAFIPPHPKVEIQITEKKSNLRKLSKLKPKKLSLIIAVLVIILSAKTILDIYFGARYLRAAKKSLENADFKNATKNSQNAKSSFQSSLGEYEIISYPFKFILPGKTKALKSALESGQTGAEATTSFVQAAQILALNLNYITQKSPNQTSLDTESPQFALNKAYFQSSYAANLAKEAQSAGIFKSKLKEAESNFSTLAQVSLTAQQLSALMTNITGTDSPKTYLILLENNAELRPGGGFIGNYSIVTFQDGKLKDISVDDIYNIDGQLKEKISPPLVLAQKLGVDNFYLRDSNWTTDFDINAQTARDFYKKETGQTVNGVIAIDMSFVQKLLEKMGPVKLDDYNEQITSANLFEKGEYYAEVGFFPGSTQKKDFFGSLTKKLLQQVTDSFSQKTNGTNSQWLAFVQATSDSLQEKHMLLSFDDQDLIAYVKSKNWDNELPPSLYNPNDDTQESRDFLAISEANVGANKVNHYLTRKVSYDMTVDRDAGLVATTTITYQNNSPADTWPAGAYVNYLRLYVPQNSSLESYTVDGSGIDLTQTEQPKNKKQIDTAPQTSTEGNLTVFANIVEVPVKATKTFVFKYRIPKNIKLETAPTYSFYTSKQPGTDKDPISFTFNLPAYLKIDSINGSTDASNKQNYTSSTYLGTDRTWEIKISKK